MIWRQAVYVGWIIEITLALHLHKTRVLLTITLQPRPTEGCSMGAPVRRGQLARAVPTDMDSAVDNRNQMCVGDKIENMPAPWPINTREQHIAIERGSVPTVLIHRRVDRIHEKPIASRPGLQVPGKQLDLIGTYITGSGVQQPVEVTDFHAIEIDEGDVLKSGSSEGFRNEPTHAAGANDTDTQARQLRLSILAPGRHGSYLRVCNAWPRGQALHISEREPVTHYAHAGAPLAQVCAWCTTTPEASTPTKVAGKCQADEGQVSRAEHGSCMGLLRNNIRRAHVLPSMPL